MFVLFVFFPFWMKEWEEENKRKRWSHSALKFSWLWGVFFLVINDFFFFFSLQNKIENWNSFFLDFFLCVCVCLCFVFFPSQIVYMKARTSRTTKPHRQLVKPRKTGILTKKIWEIKKRKRKNRRELCVWKRKMNKGGRKERKRKKRIRSLKPKKLEKLKK